MRISLAIHGGEIADDLFEQCSADPNWTDASRTVCTKFLTPISLSDNTSTNEHAGVIRSNIEVEVIAVTFVVVG